VPYARLERVQRAQMPIRSCWSIAGFVIVEAETKAIGSRFPAKVEILSGLEVQRSCTLCAGSFLICAAL
jgi:hypothetical protein